MTETGAWNRAINFLLIPWNYLLGLIAGAVLVGGLQMVAAQAVVELTGAACLADNVSYTGGVFVARLVCEGSNRRHYTTDRDIVVARANRAGPLKVSCVIYRWNRRASCK